MILGTIHLVRGGSGAEATVLDRVGNVLRRERIASNPKAASDLVCRAGGRLAWVTSSSPDESVVVLAFGNPAVAATTSSAGST
ncbi:MAG: hypothetical protein ACYDCL_01165 [Myxococcales bacterium]